MNKKETKNDLNNLIKWNEPQYEELKYSNKDGSEEIHILVKHGISLMDRINMVKGIYALVVIDDDELSVDNYQPYLLTYAKRWAVIANFSDAKLPNDIEQLNKIVMNTSLFEDIMDVLPEESILTIDSIFHEADLLIKYYVNRVVAGTNMQVISKLINGITDSLTEQLKGIDRKEITGLMETLKNVDTNKIVEGILKFKDNQKPTE